jgi:riboflavin kinase/FMN adenylyltransferase
MKVRWTDYRQVTAMTPRSTDGRVICIGNFDGFHRGHQKVVRQTCQEAERRGLQSLLFTFDPHPRKFFLGDKSDVCLILNPREKSLILERTSFDSVLIQNFDREFSQLNPKEFIQQVLVDALQARVVIVGRDFRFGSRAEGRIENLLDDGRFEVLLTEQLDQMGERVSSSHIRQLIKVGNLEAVGSLLGYPWFAIGDVIRGDGRGRTLGWPTANMKIDKECLPPFGVYESMAVLEDGRIFRAAVNGGVRPTFGASLPQWEAHLIGLNEDLYGQKLRCHLVRRLRGEAAFSSAEELKKAIEADITAVQKSSSPVCDPLSDAFPSTI